MTSSRLAAASVAVILLVLAACTSSQTTSTEDETTVDDGRVAASVEVDDLDGTSWTLLFAGGPEGDIAMIDGWPVTMTFDGFILSGTAACNGYGASYRLDGSSFRIAEIGSEDAGCEPAVQEVERKYLLALQDVGGINLIGDELALSGPATELIFRRNADAPIEQVTATMWLLEATLQDGVATPVAGEPATLVVQSAGLLTASTGCRTLNGTYIVSGNEIILNNFSANGACRTSLRSQDSSVVSVLGDGFVPEVEGDQLVLTSPGNQGLRYRATTEAEVATLPGSAAPTDAELIDSVQWIFTGGSDADGSIDDPRSIGDQQITLVVRNGTFSGVAHCNTYTGQAEIGSGQWSLTEIAAGNQSCGPEFDVIAARYLEALPLMSEFGIEGGGNRLTTNGSDIELSFERAG